MICSESHSNRTRATETITSRAGQLVVNFSILIGNTALHIMLLMYRYGGLTSVHTRTLLRVNGAARMTGIKARVVLDKPGCVVTLLTGNSPGIGAKGECREGSE